MVALPIVMPNGGGFWGEVMGVLKRLKTQSSHLGVGVDSVDDSDKSFSQCPILPKCGR